MQIRDVRDDERAWHRTASFGYARQYPPAVAGALLSAIAHGRSLVVRADSGDGLILVETTRTGGTVTHAAPGDDVAASWHDDRGTLFGRLPPDAGFVAVEVEGDEEATVHLAGGVWLAALPVPASATVVFHDARGGETARHRVDPPD
jgi:hypothetical protein